MDLAQQQQRSEALTALEDIAELKRTKAFARYFLAEPERRIKEIDRKLRDRKLTEADRQFHLGQLDVLERWRDKLTDDHKANASLVDG
jgi:hypothetical protein